MYGKEVQERKGIRVEERESDGENGKVKVENGEMRGVLRGQS